MRKLVFVLALFFVLTACSYQATTSVSPAYNVYSSYEDKIPGSFALYVDSDEMKGTYKVRGFTCSAHKFPIDAQKSFEISVLKTTQDLFENIELVTKPLSKEQLASLNYDAIVIVEAEDIDVKISVIQGFWSGEIEAEVEIVASVIVDSKNERILGATVTAEKDSLHPAGAACSGGANALGEATNESLEETMKRLGEKLTNSKKLRNMNTSPKAI
ncbi:hypothetical protein WH95_01170 [Kiloniella litopenaei]|uniref:Lipoprotein n=1 Tax=Kiloniella litopenaei TaxID=1549748 RepID=A0A0M2RFD3_9PROT|nr:hypothetical protein [Kiloniella litopenaei]KKJ78720.1 hypothetical protein WH95_01170 [Kiloniella litopenaei]